MCLCHNKCSFEPFMCLDRVYTSNVKLLSLRMCLWRSLCSLYLLACQMKVTVGDSGLCCCVYVTLSSANQFPCVLIGISWNFVFFTLLPLMLLHLLPLMPKYAPYASFSLLLLLVFVLFCLQSETERGPGCLCRISKQES